MSRASPSENSAASTSSTYSVSLSRYAAKLSRHRLSHISLANILAGHTCSPIGLTDFEAYLARKERSLENLHFAVWYQSYRKRYFALAAVPRSQVRAHHRSDPSHFSLPTPARTSQRISEIRRHSEGCVCPTRSPTDTAFSTSSPSVPRRSSVAPICYPPTVSYFTNPFPRTSLRRQQSDALGDSTRAGPFQLECARVVATFLTPGAPKELMLSAEVREALLRELAWNTHPDAFRSAYEVAVEALETFSLPRFLEYASANINRPKQIFYYSVGIFDMLFGLVLATMLIVFLPHWMSEASRRAWRVVAVPIFSLGSMQAYSAWRGFCSEVWGRGNTQLRVWELEETDPEAVTSSPTPMKFPLQAIESDKRTVALPSVYEEEPEGCCSSQQSRRTSSSTFESPKSPCTPMHDAYDDASLPSDFDLDFILEGTHESRASAYAHNKHIDYVKVRAIDPYSKFARVTSDDALPAVRVPSLNLWGWEGPLSTSMEVRTDHTQDIMSSWGLGRTTSATTEYRRPPVFGPEQPVLDPHIRAVHRSVMRDMLVTGFVCTVIFTAIILAVPSVQG
ncbi:hypothetical protein C2E23DRAFT_893818 [Lenzites betulinus]|nr:hypothetical protein C2E23DRAFT_893818 [Lenzites betulinus]